VRKVIILFVSQLFVSGAFVHAQVRGAAAGGADPAIAEVDGVKFSLTDVEQKRPAMFQARAGFYEAQRKAIEGFVDDYLLDRQAEKERTTVAELLEKHVNSKVVKDISENALRVYYEGVDTTEPFEKVRDNIVEHLRQRRAAKAKAVYVQTLRKQANITIRLTAPRTQVSLEDVQIRGRRDAPVVLVEFADYECPYCQQVQPTLDRVISEYKDKIAFAYKDAPLPNHPSAQKAAEATHCAGAQGKYWEYHDLLLTSKQLDVPRLKERAGELKLNISAFNSCLDSGEKSGIIKGHLAEAQALGLQGTPSFFINGRFFSGVMTYEKLREIIEEELLAASVPARVAAAQ